MFMWPPPLSNPVYLIYISVFGGGGPVLPARGVAGPAGCGFGRAPRVGCPAVHERPLGRCARRNASRPGPAVENRLLRGRARRRVRHGLGLGLALLRLQRTQAAPAPNGSRNCSRRVWGGDAHKGDQRLARAVLRGRVAHHPVCSSPDRPPNALLDHRRSVLHLGGSRLLHGRRAVAARSGRGRATGGPVRADGPSAHRERAGVP